MSVPNVEVWSYDQICDPHFKDVIGETICDTNGLVRMELSDGAIVVSRRMAWMNLYWFNVPLAFNTPIAKRHFVKRIALNDGSHAKAMERFYDEFMGQNIHNAKKLKQVLWDSYNALYMAASSWLLPYSRSIDLIDMAEIINDPKMRKIIDTRERINVLMSSKEVEKHIDIHNKEIMDLLNEKDGVKNKTLFSYRRVDQLNRFQVPQTIYSFGIRTDVDDTIVRYPVVGSALSGLRNIMEYAVESLSAKKSSFYNKSAVSGSQYFGRRQHLSASTLAHIYSGDCGSKNPVPFEVNDHNYKNLIGKLIVEDGRYVWLTANNVKDYVGKTVLMRSALTCKHTDGVCEACGGRVIQNVNRKLNIGILSAMHLIEPVTQGILSAKHLIKTNSLVYSLDERASKYLECITASEVAWSPKILGKLNGCKLGVKVSDFPKFSDIAYLKHGRSIKEAAFSRITALKIRTSEGKEDDFSMTCGKQVPHFSAEMLFYIKDHVKETITDKEEGIIWIPLCDTMCFPLFRVTILNDNLLAFEKRAENFLKSDIKHFHTCADALREFTELLYNKISVNIAHPELLLKSYMITSPTDYRIPMVTDQNDVHFQGDKEILTYRHVGVCLAFEGLVKYLQAPATYLTVKQGTPFDLMIGYTDY